jgi:hypothetical protein
VQLSLNWSQQERLIFQPKFKAQLEFLLLLLLKAFEEITWRSKAQQGAARRSKAQQGVDWRSKV